MSSSRSNRAAAVAAFLALIIGANVLTSSLPLVPAGFGLVTTAGTWCAGLVLLARDWLHKVAGRGAVLACIVAGATASAVLTEPALATASAAAFAVSELLDLLVYERLERRSWVLAAALSNTVGSAADSVAFLWLAGIPLAVAMPGQMLAKTTAWAVVLVLVVVVRAVLRYRQRPAGA